MVDDLELRVGGPVPPTVGMGMDYGGKERQFTVYMQEFGGLIASVRCLAYLQPRTEH